MKNLEIMKNGKKIISLKKLEKLPKIEKNVWKSQNHEIEKRCKIAASSINHECNGDHFSAKNLPNNLLKEPGPSSEMRSGPGYFSCTEKTFSI